MDRYDRKLFRKLFRFRKKNPLNILLVKNVINRQIKIIEGTRILSELMYPNTEFDYKYLWMIKKSTDWDDTMLFRKAVNPG